MTIPFMNVQNITDRMQDWGKQHTQCTYSSQKNENLFVITATVANMMNVKMNITKTQQL